MAATKNRLPKVYYQNNPVHLSEICLAISKGWPVVVDYGSTFGTSFIPHVRKKIAQLRQEALPLRTVSLITTYRTASKWVDYARIHPKYIPHIKHNILSRLKGIAFIRFPANPETIKQLGKYFINDQGEVQVFLVPENEPLMKHLRQKHHIPFIAVRSSNLENQPEEYTPHGAYTYACQIKSPLIAYINESSPQKKNILKRFGSQPIVKIPSDNTPGPLILVRSSNTHPDAIKNLLIETVSEVGFLHQEEKQRPIRDSYNPIPEIKGKITPHKIKKSLLKASGL
jgi:hypothetical protein